MASTNKTSNLELSQFIATDTPTWLVDYNGDMEKIDAGVGRVKELAESASTQAVGVASGLQATNQTVTTLSGQVANVQNQANTTTASVNGINQRLGNADISGIGDGTITGAISMQTRNSTVRYNPNSDMVQIYYNGVWVDWKAGALQSYYAYKNGINSAEFQKYQSEGDGSVEFNGDYISLVSVPHAGGTTYPRMVYAPIDVTNYTKLKLKYKVTSINSGNVTLGLKETMSNSLSESIVHTDNTSPVVGNIEQITCDVSEVIGTKFVYAGVFRCTAEFYEIVLE